MTLLTQLRSDYDLVLVDAPPMGIVGDAKAIAPSVDALLVVAREGMVERADLEDLVRELEPRRDPALGFVLTGVDMNDLGYGAKSPAPRRRNTPDTTEMAPIGLLSRANRSEGPLRVCAQAETRDEADTSWPSRVGWLKASFPFSTPRTLPRRSGGSLLRVVARRRSPSGCCLIRPVLSSCYGPLRSVAPLTLSGGVRPLERVTQPRQRGARPRRCAPAQPCARRVGASRLPSGLLRPQRLGEVPALWRRGAHPRRAARRQLARFIRLMLFAPGSRCLGSAAADAPALGRGPLVRGAALS